MKTLKTRVKSTPNFNSIELGSINPDESDDEI